MILSHFYVSVHIFISVKHFFKLNREEGVYIKNYYKNEILLRNVKQIWFKI